MAEEWREKWVNNKKIKEESAVNDIEIIYWGSEGNIHTYVAVCMYVYIISAFEFFLKLIGKFYIRYQSLNMFTSTHFVVHMCVYT